MEMSDESEWVDNGCRQDNFEQGGYSELGHSRLELLRNTKEHNSTNDLLIMSLDVRKFQNLSKSDQNKRQHLPINSNDEADKYNNG